MNLPQNKYMVLFVAVLASFTDLTLWSLIIPPLPNIVQQFGGSTDLAGILFAVFALLQLPAILIAGPLSDRPSIGRRLPMIVSLIGLVGSTVMCACAQNLAMLFVARAIQGLSGGANMVLTLSLISEVFDEDEIGRANAIMSMVQFVAQIVGPVIGGTMYDTVGYTAMFMPIVALVVLDAALRIFFLDEAFIQSKAAEKKRRADFEREQDTTTDSTKRTVWTLMLTPDFMVSVTMFLAIQGYFGAQDVIFALWLESTPFNWSTTKFGLLFSLLCIGALAGSIPAGILADKWRKKYVIGLGCIISLPITVMAGYIDTLWQVCLLFVLNGFTAAFAYNPPSAEISEIAYGSGSGHLSGTAMSIFVCVQSAGLAVGPVIANAVYNMYGMRGTYNGFAIMLGMIGLIFIGFCVLVKPLKATSTAESVQATKDALAAQDKAAAANQVVVLVDKTDIKPDVEQMNMKPMNDIDTLYAKDYVFDYEHELSPVKEIDSRQQQFIPYVQSHGTQ